MRTPHYILRRCAVLIGAAALFPLVGAQENPRAPVTLQAVGPHLSPEIVRLLARSAEPTVLRDANFMTAAATTPRAIITKLCGSMRQEYLYEAARENGLPVLHVDEPLGDKAREFKWPACLYVKPVAVPAQSKVTVTVQPGDTAFKIYKAHTNGGGSEKAMERFFGMSIAALNAIKPGDKLSIASFSMEVSFVPREGVPPGQFASDLKSLDPSNAMIKEVESQEGDIVVGTRDDGTIAAGPSCKGYAASPISAAQIVEAYRHTKGRAMSPDLRLQGGVAEVAVVDNGFFGARLSADGTDPFRGSAFREAFFKRDQDYVIAAPILLGAEIRPLNYSNALTPGDVSSHGTHVAGLVLGGPYFSGHWDAISPGAAWASLTILNVGKGGRQLLKGAPTVLANSLAVDGASRIVNLSIAHDGNSDPRVGKQYQQLVDAARHSLFVAAAGNYGRDAGEQFVYPAALGGVSSKNVLTVAALDGADQLATFSNDGLRVDLAAPGCQILSWTDIGGAPVAMNGTSQAAPLATFAATLIRSIASVASPAVLKTRLIASGDLLPEAHRHRTAYGVKLNVHRALLFLDDYARATGPDGGEFLGVFKPSLPIKCLGDNGLALPKNLKDMWALKRDGGQSYYYAGKGAALPSPPCEVVQSDQVKVNFQARHRIRDGAIEQLASPMEFSWPVSEVQDLVMALPVADLR